MDLKKGVKKASKLSPGSQSKRIHYKIGKQELLDSLEFIKFLTRVPAFSKSCLVDFSKRKLKGHAVESCTYILKEVQRCLARHEWSAAVELSKILIKLHPKKEYLPYILQCVHVLLLNHPNSSSDMIENFKRSTFTRKMNFLNPARFH